MLNRIDWNKIFDNITCQDQLMDRFIETLNEVLDIIAPVKKLSKNEGSLNEALDNQRHNYFNRCLR